MNCKEVRAVAVIPMQESTRAQRAAMLAHVSSCGSCLRWAKTKAEERRASQSLAESLEDIAASRATLRDDMEDREFLETVLGESIGET